METNLSNCSTGELTDSFLIRILGSLGAVSVVTCLVALCWLFYLKLHKQFIYRLAAYQVMASLFHASMTICQFLFIDYNDLQAISCAVVGYLFMVAVWMKVCFGCWITFHLFCFAVLLKNMRKLEPLYVISSILFPIAISSIPLITDSYGPSGEWCSVQRKKCGKSYSVGNIELIAVWLGPAFVILVLQCIAMVTMMITVYYRAHRKLGENVFGREQNNIAFRQLLPLVAYPMLFCILIIPPLIARVYGFASSTPNKGLQILLTICVPAFSLSAGVTLIVHIIAVKRTEVLRLMLSMTRPREARNEGLGTRLRNMPITEELANNTYSRDASGLLASIKDDARSQRTSVFLVRNDFSNYLCTYMQTLCASNERNFQDFISAMC